jgi:ParB-like chromosome segregation protein Spo0J
MTEQTYAEVPLDQLEEHPDNPRRGDVDAIAAAIAANGWHGALIAQRSTSRVLAGNHRLRAARLLGMDTVPVLWLDVDDEVAQRILVADNRATDLGYFDEEALAQALQSAGDLAGTLFSEADLELLAAPLPPERETMHMSLVEPAGQQTEAYRAAGTRSLVLPFELAEYVELTDKLRVMRGARGLTSNAEVIAALIREAP